MAKPFFFASNTPQVKSYLGKESPDAHKKTSNNKKHDTKESLVKPKLKANTTTQVKIHYDKESTDTIQNSVRSSCYEQILKRTNNVPKKKNNCHWIMRIIRENICV